jgi:hypothetical protein
MTLLNVSDVYEVVETSRCRMPSRDMHGSMEYLNDMSSVQGMGQILERTYLRPRMKKSLRRARSPDGAQPQPLRATWRLTWDSSTKTSWSAV